MSSILTLTILDGSSQGQSHSFDRRSTIWVGRHPDCQIQLPDSPEYDKVSRRHCIIDINPPKITIRDNDSYHGTYVIGSQNPNQPDLQKLQQPVKSIDRNLHSGNIIRLGNIHLRLEIAGEQPNYDPPVAPPTPHIMLVAAKKAWSLYKNWLEIPDQPAATATPSNNNPVRATGTKVIGNYQDVTLIGKGSYGEVFLADNGFGQQVAIKVMQPEAAATSGTIEKFEREIENAKALNHPNVVRLLGNGFDSSNKCLYYTMEYCAVGNLDTLMTNLGGILPWDMAECLIFQILDGLEYTHSAKIPYVRLADGSFTPGQGLVHRDIKPANIMIAKSNRGFIAKIGDFGLAKAYDLAGLSGHTMADDRAGTKGFMCRKQFFDFQASKPEVDLWATAACLYYMLTDRLPRDFSGDNDKHGVLRQDVIPIRDHNPDLPPALAAVIDRALWEEPDKEKAHAQVLHYQSARQLKADLAAAFGTIAL